MAKKILFGVIGTVGTALTVMAALQLAGVINPNPFKPGTAYHGSSVAARIGTLALYALIMVVGWKGLLAKPKPPAESAATTTEDRDPKE